MNKIQILDTSTVNRIAAGEVVEKPASVVKELLENSIDAGASTVTIEISEGGISKIRITDNGIGIPKEQVKTAFLNHATSKIQTVDDIFNISSLGFRGEALASIASVSQLEIITKPLSEIMGKRLEIYGGEIRKEEDIGCPNGTTLIISNLFFNTPARQKFLKKPTTEAGYVADMISKIALGHPEISIKFINNNKISFQTLGNNNLKSVTLNVYGKEVISKLIDLDITKDNFKIIGLIAKPELNRSNRTYENLFINGRYIKSDLVRNAVEAGYKTKIMAGKFPMYILNLILPPYEYDVNVHPTKLEVRFKEEDFIYEWVYTSILETLQSNNLIPKISIEHNTESKILKSESKTENIAISKQQDLKNIDMPSSKYSEPKINIPVKILEPVISTSNEKVLEKSLISYRIIGQIFGTYWLIEQENSIFMIDQHAAHERILYEEFTNAYKINKFDSQILLQPLTVKLTLKEKQILLENLKLFENIGFQLEEFGDSSYIIRAMPIIFEKPENVDFFNDVLDLLNSSTPNASLEIKFAKIATISCKAAVKAHNKLSETEIYVLIEKLMKLENPFNCPHGRPTIIELSKKEIEKKFKRIL